MRNISGSPFYFIELSYDFYLYLSINRNYIEGSFVDNLLSRSIKAFNELINL